MSISVSGLSIGDLIINTKSGKDDVGLVIKKTNEHIFVQWSRSNSKNDPADAEHPYKSSIGRDQNLHFPYKRYTLRQTLNEEFNKVIKTKKLSY